MSENILKVALVQTDIYWENIDANLSDLEEKLWSLEEEIDLIIFPETFNTGFSMNSKLAEVPGLKTQKWLTQMASQKKALIGGSYLVNDNGNYHNRFLFAFPDGTMAHYDKKYLFTLSKESQVLKPGSKKLIVEYKGWKICPMICYDLRFPEWSRNRFNSKEESPQYDLLIYGANWPSARIEAWNSLLKARAIENQSYVMGVNRIGNDGNDLTYNGQSQALDFKGTELIKPNSQEGIEIVEIHKEPLANFRKEFPFLKDAIY